MREEKPRQGDLTFSGGGKLKPARGSERPGGMTDVEAPGGRNPAGPMTAGGLGGSGRSEPSRPRGGRWFFSQSGGSHRINESGGGNYRPI